MSVNEDPEFFRAAPMICFFTNFIISILIFKYGYREYWHSGGLFAGYAVFRFYAWCIVITGMYNEDRKFIKSIAIFGIFEISLICAIRSILNEKNNSCV